MSVWLAIPSKRPAAVAAAVLSKWRGMGYKIALWVDLADLTDQNDLRRAAADFTISASEFPGYGAAVNELCREVIERDPLADWIVTGGDDVHPDPNRSAYEIAAECSNYFLEANRDKRDPYGATFGVMQPTGDRWGENPASPDPKMRSAYIDRICGSPFMGREFCRRMYGGTGPLSTAYSHMYVDEELHEVAKRLGVLLQRRDLTHHHDHWGRKEGASMGDCPPFLLSANSSDGWRKAKAIFTERAAAGFPGYEPIR